MPWSLCCHRGSPSTRRRRAIPSAGARGRDGRRWRPRGRRAGRRSPRPSRAGASSSRRVHTPAYLDALAADGRARAAMLDPDTFTSPESWEIARLAAGAAIQARRARCWPARPRRPRRSCARPGTTRPPTARMGFCLLNNVAVAAARAARRGRRARRDRRLRRASRQRHAGASSSAIRDVLYVSTAPVAALSRDRGRRRTSGRDAATGFTVNVPLPPWCVDADYDLAFDAGRRARRCGSSQPAVLLVSAGFDAHERDPLARMRLTAAGFAAMTRPARGDGRRVLRRPAGAGHGRRLRPAGALAASLDAVIGVLAGEPPRRRPARAAARPTPAPSAQGGAP